MKIYSVSKLNEWNQCQLKYFGHHIERENWERERSTNIQLLLGELIHAFFEEFYAKAETTLKFKKEIISLAAWKDSFAEQWLQKVDGEIVCSKQELDLQLDKGIICLENFYKREKQRDFKIPLFTERAFTVALGDLFKVTGKIDRIDEELDGSITIIDYKISNSPKTVGQAHHDYQLATYAFACEQDILRKRPSQVGWYYPVQGQDIFVEPSIETQEELLSAFMEIDSLVSVRGCEKSLYTTSTRTGFCDNCGYRHKCPEFSHEQSETQELPDEKEIKVIINEAFELNEKLKADEKRLKELKTIIQSFMEENNLTNYENVRLQKQDRGNYSAHAIWSILKELENGYDFIDVRKTALKENFESFSLQEQKVIGNAYIPKQIVFPLLKIK